ncbi:MAG TPA: 3-oxoacyl-[acyl-carrier-protein] synthase III C-terminal domain-containing protein [Thermoanaerobaculia bacterium]|nr:3-oxoacyl-[acyl-carrier-protein] synthase III C-terminal domain-containing protein [Thermoanaerobaculia bacterium]
MLQHFSILGTGLYLPQRKLTAEDADDRAGLSRGWTRAHTGVVDRYECVAPESLATMACNAIHAAMQDASVSWRDIDLILDASNCRHQPIPCNAAYLQHTLGADARGIPCMDVQSTCLGFIVALQVANGLFAAGAYKHILIVCSEQALLGVNWREPESACLMGDGAAAVVVRRADPAPGYFFAHQTFGEHLETCQIRGGGHVLPVTTYTAESDSTFRFHMDGPQLMRTAAKYLPPMTESLLADAGIAPNDLHVIPHQASPKALNVMRRLLRFRAERFQNRVAQMGNLIAASIPAVLHQCRAERITKAGDAVLLIGTSAGYSQAGLIFRM